MVVSQRHTCNAWLLIAVNRVRGSIDTPGCGYKLCQTKVCQRGQCIHIDTPGCWYKLCQIKSSDTDSVWLLYVTVSPSTGHTERARDTDTPTHLVADTNFVGPNSVTQIHLVAQTDRPNCVRPNKKSKRDPASATTRGLFTWTRSGCHGSVE